MRCPICKRVIDGMKAEGVRECFPFCSERCKLIDLGRWLGGRYQIPADDPEGKSQSARDRRDRAWGE